MYRFKTIKRRKYISLLWKFRNSEKSSHLAYKCIGPSFPSMGGSAAWLLSCHSSWLMPHLSFYSLLMCTSLCLYHLLDLLVFFGHLLLEIILKSAIAIVLYKIVEGFLRNRLHLVKDLLAKAEIRRMLQNKIKCIGMLDLGRNFPFWSPVVAHNELKQNEIKINA